ncbi:uncharacterized protein [Nicotiana sylvestris]|uniref:uncharacterized protein n=1 Tax=Nicotiana sylvestris TaxID=4096 RepID=UPI00388C4F84
MPDIPKYNGTTDPNEHITTYTCGIKGNDLEDDEIESVLLKKFGETLSKGAMIWYHKLPSNSIDSFAMLADSFVKAHAGAIKVATRKSDIFKIKKRENEMTGPHQSKIKVDDDQLGAPSGSIYPSRLPARESENANRGPRSNMERYQPYIKDRRNMLKHNMPQNDRRADRGQSSQGLMSKFRFDTHLGPVEAPRLSEYKFNVDASGIISAIGKIRDTRWPKPIQTDPSQKNPDLMCNYHGTHGHKTEDCRQLREEVTRLFNKDHLREFLSDRAKNNFRERDAGRKNEPEEPQHVIHMIIGGVDVPQRPIFKSTKVLITREKRTRDYMPEDILTFSSSANIIQSRVVEQLELLDQIIPASQVLNGFNMASETTKGEIILLVNMAGTIQDTKFHVIEGDMRYNALLGRPWIHSMRAVLSTLYQMMKFPTKDGVKIVYGEQHAAKEMFVVHDLAPVSAPSTSEETKDK